jgi:hypothetical protein
MNRCGDTSQNTSAFFGSQKNCQIFRNEKNDTRHKFFTNVVRVECALSLKANLKPFPYNIAVKPVLDYITKVSFIKLL